MTRTARTLLAVAVLVLAVPGGPTAATASSAGEPAIELVAQTPVTAPGSTVQVTVRLPGVPTDGSLLMTIHGRVRSRSELAASMEGDSLRNLVFQTVVPLATLPPTSTGARTIAVSLQAVTAAGVYPLELIARDAADHELATLVTHLIVPPTAEGSPPLAIVPLAHIAAEPVPPSAPGAAALDETAIEPLAALTDAVGAVDGATVTLAIGPETLDALAASGEAGTAVVDGLRDLVVTDPLLTQPFVAISLDALTTAGLSTELLRQLEHGTTTLHDALGATPVADTWLASDDLGAAGLHRLEQLGTKHAVVPSSLVEPLPDGVLDLSLAQPFLLDPPRSERAEGAGTIDALAIDPIVEQRLTAGAAALAANRTAAELATIWFEQPGIPRAAVVPLGTDLGPGVAEAVLADLAGSPVFRMTSLDDAFTVAAPLKDASGDQIHRALTPTPSAAFSSQEIAGVQDARRALESARGMVGPDSPLLPPADAQLLLATAAELDPAVRQEQAASVRRAIGDLEAKVTGPVQFTLTLTSRNGTIPLTLHNDAGIPLDVVIHLDSPKLDFPNGNDVPVRLEEPVTRFDIPVRARASGASRLVITVTTPDGQSTLVTSRYTVRSTAVAGAGLLLSIGAGLFLLVWWARHWRNTRRNARLVAAHAHPAVGQDAG